MKFSDGSRNNYMRGPSWFGRPFIPKDSSHLCCHERAGLGHQNWLRWGCRKPWVRHMMWQLPSHPGVAYSEQLRSKVLKIDKTDVKVLLLLFFASPEAINRSKLHEFWIISPFSRRRIGAFNDDNDVSKVGSNPLPSVNENGVTLATFVLRIQTAMNFYVRLQQIRGQTCFEQKLLRVISTAAVGEVLGLKSKSQQNASLLARGRETKTRDQGNQSQKTTSRHRHHGTAEKTMKRETKRVQ